MIDLGCLGLIQSRFRLFQHDSRPISVFFSRYGQFQPLAGTTQFWSNWPGLTWIRAESVQIPKKKKTQTWHRRTGSRVRCRTPCRVTLDSNAVPSQLRRCFRAFWRWGWFWKLCLQEIALVFFFKFLFIFIIIIINFFLQEACMTMYSQLCYKTWKTKVLTRKSLVRCLSQVPSIYCELKEFISEFIET